MIEFQQSGVQSFRAVVFISVLVCINLLSAWYLSRRSFREFAVQYVTECDKKQHSRMMQKAAQERTEDEIRKMRS